jgi:putative Mg2+ transporter-C (MgtC) family protein
MTIVLSDVVKLLLAVLIGGLVGVEREFRTKAAGFRTIIFICVGATIFTALSFKLGGDKDPVRIAANIVVGIGFLGAGVILHDDGRIIGLTTASTIWLVAALGMGIGGGYYVFAGAATVTILIVLWTFPKLDGWIHSARETRTYQIFCLNNREKFVQLDAMFRQCGLCVRNQKQTKRGDEMICTWDAFGSVKHHDQLVEKLFADDDVKEFRF